MEQQYQQQDDDNDDGAEVLVNVIDLTADSPQNELNNESDNNDDDDAGRRRQQKRKRRRRRQQLQGTDDDSLLRQQQKQQQIILITSFQHQNHSLRVSASNVAAMVGLHPFKNLGELFLSLVYQGYVGQLLMQRDAKLLELDIVQENEQDTLRQLATKTGSTNLTKALEDAFKVKNGTKRITSIDDATQVKEKVIKEVKEAATTKDKDGKSQQVLSNEEIKVLVEGTRSAVDTGFGIFHEDDALNKYEKLIGYDVYDRNSEIRSWPFQLLEDDDADADVDSKQQQQPLHPIMPKTVVPMGPAKVLHRTMTTAAVSIEPTQPQLQQQLSGGVDGDGSESKNAKEDNGNNNSNSGPSSLPTASESHNNNNNKRQRLSPAGDDGSSSSSNNNNLQPRQKDVVEAKDDDYKKKEDGKKEEDFATAAAAAAVADSDLQSGPSRGDVIVGDETAPTTATTGTTKTICSSTSKPPFFSILGSVDGIRDELAPSSNAVADTADDDWYLRGVVVEIKHRMKRIHEIPPLYEQIQAITYCQMYDTENADLVQVLRQQQQKGQHIRKRRNNNDKKKTAQPPPAKRRRQQKQKPVSNVEDNSEVGGVPVQENDNDKVQASEAHDDVPMPTSSDGGGNSNKNGDGPEDAQKKEQPDENVGDNAMKNISALAAWSAGSCSAASSACRDASTEEKKDEESTAAAEEEESSSYNNTNQNQEVEEKESTYSDSSKPSATVAKTNDASDRQNGDKVNEDGDNKCTKDALLVPGGEPPFQPQEKKMMTKEQHQSPPPRSPQFEMKVCRVSLDDPIHQHRHHWNEIILPRLRSFVEAVYSVRNDDGKRYRLLVASASSSTVSTSLMEGAWEILHEECPWLADCDTVYNREMRKRR